MKVINFFLLASLALIAYACSKDKFETNPTLVIDGYSATVVPQNSAWQANFTYTDKEGDLGEGILHVKVDRKNRLPLIPSDPFIFEYTQVLPKFDKKTKGEIQFTLPYNNIRAQDPFENDSLQFFFCLQDAAGNLSDTAKSELIIVE